MSTTFLHEIPYGQDGADVGVAMGSNSDWPTMVLACMILDQFGVPWERRILSAHRTPDRMFDYAGSAEARGLKVIIAGAGGAAHLPGCLASKTLLPVHGVPILSNALRGLDSLLSIVQMPQGVPTATFSIGEAGAVNAALQAIRVLALSYPELRERLRGYVIDQTASVAMLPFDKP